MKLFIKTRCILLALILTFLLPLQVHASGCVHQYEQRRQEPSCTKTGMTWRECILCGNTIDFATLPPLGHRFLDWYVLAAPTCTQEGIQARTCKVCSHQETATIPRLDHDYLIEIIPPTCTVRGYTQHTCIGCGDQFKSDYTEAKGHRFSSWYLLKEPTCTREGTQARDCTVCGFQEKTALPTQGHSYAVKIVPPTCTAQGYTQHICSTCGDQFKTDYTEAKGHRFSSWYLLKEPTCTREGTQARDCTVCGFQEKITLPTQGHSYVVEVIPPTCTARGYTSHHCPVCGDRFRSSYTDPLGHRYDDGVIIQEPTLTAMGRILYTCTGCGDTYQQSIPKLTNPFKDIDKQAYYFTPVIWAVNNGITSGLDETHFGPDVLCNRAQAVTFLWRSAGKPEPKRTTNPFRDVNKGSFYEKAVLWAYENGITTGTDSRHFSPNAPCSRAQVVTFLHRLHGCPEPTVTTAFPDVKVGSFYRKAVLWAAQREITVGMDGGYFRPELSCNRAQIVTFLYRDVKNP